MLKLLLHASLCYPVLGRIIDARAEATNNSIHSFIMPKRKYRSVPFDSRTAEVAPAHVLPDKPQVTLKAEEDGNVEKKPRTYSSGIDCHIKKGIDKDKIISDYVSKYGEHVVSQ